MIQIKHIMIGDYDKDMDELSKVLNWLDKENVEYDLIPPEYFDG